MALSFTNSAGHLFNRLGAIFAAIKANQAFQATLLPGLQIDIAAQFTTRQDLLPTFQTTVTSAQNAGQTFSQALSKSLGYALPELIRQMVAAGATVTHNVVGATFTAATTNTGNGTLLISTTDEWGNNFENVLAEVFPVTCVADSQPGQGTAAGQERFMARGYLPYGKLDFHWPAGTGVQASLTAASADAGPSTAHVLTNSDFETWTGSGTSGSLTSWTPTVGSIGTTINQTSGAYRGSYALAITGNTTSQLTQITQALRTASVSGIIQPETKYALMFRSKVSTVPAAGVLRVALKDTVNGSIVGGSTVTLSGETSSYALHTATFNTPLALPATLIAVVELTTAIDSGKSVLVDDLCIGAMTQYAHGIYLTVIPGSINFIRGDTFTVTVTNDRGGQLQEWFNRCFNLDALGLLLPSAASASATIPDSVIA
jgi:hypothetical protein